MKYPDYDRKLRQVESWVGDADLAVRHCRHRRLAVQAGGAVGVWPAYLAQHFDHVLTFEPEPGNFALLLENTDGIDNIGAWRAALGSRPGHCGLVNDPVEADNAGTWHAVPGTGVSVTTIDDLQLAHLDLLCLDVEGGELDALIGAAATLDREHPVVMLEEKPLPHMTGPADAARAYLEREFGYRVVERVHRDVILAW